MRLIIIFLALLVSVQAYANPRLNFSDLISGPATGNADTAGGLTSSEHGAIVTIWGNNLGSSQGTSTLSICGTSPAHIYYWKDADGALPGGPANLSTYHKMQEIAFSVPSSCSIGATTISVTTSNGTSNTLPFTVRSGNIYHAKATGSSSNIGSFSSPWLSWMNGGLDGMSAGDILYLHDGTADVTTGEKYIVSGKTGTVNSQRAVIAYPNSRYLIQATEACVDMYNSNSLVLSKLVCKSGYYDEPSEGSTTILGKVGGTGIEGAANGRLIANEITDITGKCSSGYSGAIMATCGGGACDPISNLKIYGNYIHDWGCPQTSHFEHTTYLSIRNDGYTDVEPWEVGWNLLKDNHAKYGLHNYDETYDSDNVSCGSPTGVVKIHDNFILNQKGAGINVGAKAPNGYDCWTSGSFEIFNNAVIESGKGPEDENGYDLNGIRVGDAGMSIPVKIYNNTVHGWGDDVLGAGSGIDFYETSNSGRSVVSVYNNILSDTRGGNYMGINESTYTNVTGSNNLFYSSGGTSTSTIDSRFTNNVLSNPLFVDESNDYQLTLGSQAVNAGVTGLVAVDILGISRPQDFIVDLGAFEYAGTASPINGACGTLNNTTYSTAPTSSTPNLCVAGNTVLAFTDNGTDISYGCGGIGDGATSTASDACGMTYQAHVVSGLKASCSLGRFVPD